MWSASSLPSVPTWVRVSQFCFNASVDRVTVLDNFQVLDFAARYASLPTVELLILGVSVGYQLDQVAIGIAHVQTGPRTQGA
jgi:hypothetical protein